MPWSTLEELHLGFNPLGCGSGPSLSSLLRLTSLLEKLYLQSCGLNELILDKDTGLESSLNGIICICVCMHVGVSDYTHIHALELFLVCLISFTSLYTHMVFAFPLGLSNLTHIVISRNPLQSSGIVKLFHCLPTSLLTHLDLDNTCTHQPALEQTTVANFFDQVHFKTQYNNMVVIRTNII